jgi:hypothetical protein
MDCFTLQVRNDDAYFGLRHDKHEAIAACTRRRLRALQ